MSVTQRYNVRLQMTAREEDVVTSETSHLVDAAREGDESAWRSLYLAVTPRLIALLGPLLETDAAVSVEDAAAEAWLVAAAKIGEFRGSDDDFAGWLYAIARNQTVNRTRRAHRRRTEPTSEPPEPRPARAASTDPVREVVGADRTRRLLAHLSPREAEVVTCIDVVGLDVAATARALGMRPTAVRVARHRALGRLRRLLDAEDTAAARTAQRPSGVS